MNWLTTSLKTFDERYPGVKTEYLSTNESLLSKKRSKKRTDKKASVSG
jgi:hypothetical protein